MTSRSVPATAAGRFYPADADQLRRRIEDFLRTAAVAPIPRPHAIIAPHAGYDYSGSVAGSAYAAVRSTADRPRRVALFGTSHVHNLRGLATTSADFMATPLGEVAVDRDVIHQAIAFPAGHVVIDNEAHGYDHALQVQLPFLQVVLRDFCVAPFLVGRIGPDKLANFMISLSESDDSIIIVSSDLSHFLDYQAAQEMDRQTANAIVHLDAAAVGRDQACGFSAIRGLITVARRLNWTARLLHLKNSGDTKGDKSRVVGYGAFAFGRGFGIQDSGFGVNVREADVTPES